MSKALMCILIASLCGCAGGTGQFGGREVYQALGHDPGWLLTIDRGRMKFATSTPKTLIEVTQPVPETTARGRRYGTNDLRLETWSQPCNDARSGVAFAETVRVSANGTDYHGCGGKRVPTLDR